MTEDMPNKNNNQVVISKQQSSVQIEIDSKGAKKYQVKIYDDNPDVAYKKAVEISELLDEKFGLN